MDTGLSSWRCRLRSRCSWGADNHHTSGCGQKEILSYHSLAEQRASKSSIETLWYLECSDQEDNPVNFFLFKNNSKRETTCQTMKVLWIYFSDYRPYNECVQGHTPPSDFHVSYPAKKYRRPQIEWGGYNNGRKDDNIQHGHLSIENRKAPITIR
jgi:hypothetical protein